MNKIPNNQALDAKWYQKLAKIASFEMSDFLNGNRLFEMRQQADFLAGRIRNPKLNYPNLEMSELEECIEKLGLFREEILQQEKVDWLRDCYLEKIEEKMVEVLFLSTVYELAGGQRSANCLKRWQKYNHFLYGKPKKALYDFALTCYHNYLEQVLADDYSEEVHQRARELKGWLPKGQDLYCLSMPSTKIFKRLKREFEDLINYLKIPTDGQKFSANGIAKYFRQALKFYGFKDWQVKISRNALMISVSQEKKLVSIPTNREVYGGKLVSLVVHEIATHVRRREMGEQSQLKLLGIGLANYQAGEEGLATISEQIVNGQDFINLSSIVSYLAICLASGLDGRPRDFRAMYDLLSKIYWLKEFTTENLLEGRKEREKQARQAAWLRCLRIFRGSDGQTAGLCYCKDLMYLEGRICLLGEIKNSPESFKDFFMGKYNPCLAKHQEIIQKLRDIN
jgi:hypothetical protein